MIIVIGSSMNIAVRGGSRVLSIRIRTTGGDTIGGAILFRILGWRLGTVELAIKVILAIFRDEEADDVEPL